MQVLLVDDEKSILEQAKIFLENENDRLDVETVTSPEEAFELLNKRSYDAVVSDYQMPSMDGLDFLKELREGRGSDVPFIILTGKGREEVAMKALNLGADGYIIKEGSPRAMYSQLARAIVKEVEHRLAKEREEVLHSLLRHDLRNKAQIAEGYLDLIKDSIDSDDGQVYLEKAVKSIRNGIDLIEKVRVVKRVGGEDPEEILLDPLLKKVINQYETEASQNGIEIVYEENECEKVLAGSLLEESISNLMENAIIHSGGSEIRISVEDLKDECLVTVEDDGRGIPDREKEKIFEKDFKKGKAAGSGIGLYLVKEIAESYKGRVEIEDSDLGGARFDLYLKKG